jgi:protein ImuA
MQAGLEALREQIRSIERRPTLLSAGPAPHARFDAASSRGVDERHSAGAAIAEVSGNGTWTLGNASPGDRGPEPVNHGRASLDHAIGTGGLEIGAVHEIKPAAVSAAGMGWAAAFASAYHFALALAVRRLVSAPPAYAGAPVLLCFSATQSAEMGAPYAPGLAALGLVPERLILVEAARQADVLWAIEEGLKSDGLALVLGQTDAVGLTPARRLALAAARSSTPCLLLTHPRSPAAAATATRWRIAPASSSPNALDYEAPGETRFLAGLERCRGSPVAVQPGSYLLEWCNVAYRFRVAAGVVDGAFSPLAPEGRPFRAVGGGERP